MAEGTESSATGGALSRIRGPRDFFGGLALIAIALFALWATARLPGQRGFTLGPGTAPRLFSYMLLISGVVIALMGLFVKGPRLERFSWRGPAFVLLAILVFAATIRGINVTIWPMPIRVPAFGLVIATFVSFMISTFGSTEYRLVESLAAAAAMTVFCVVLFIYLLRLSFQLWPNFL